MSVNLEWCLGGTVIGAIKKDEGIFRRAGELSTIPPWSLYIPICQGGKLRQGEKGDSHWGQDQEAEFGFFP